MRRSYSAMRSFNDSISFNSGSKTSRNSGLSPLAISRFICSVPHFASRSPKDFVSPRAAFTHIENQLSDKRVNQALSARNDFWCSLFSLYTITLLEAYREQTFSWWVVRLSRNPCDSFRQYSFSESTI